MVTKVRAEAEFDPEAGAVYIRLKDGKIARTVNVSAIVNFDIDEKRDIIGIEIVVDRKIWWLK